ncbi:Fanconi anemia group D2 protein homolog [Orussus abietinus]|uniref:Fanconi anemia group D2 protein homolog n=1 Tax=Orussus abietinus TaxID=222816 RepID=UPI000626CFC4|nr:Fanconi anemia group D2 protein homolog [Orussus abietinus]XP_012288041.1 Fanconi anemia group D2 protein homolog [Orussus abietinus]XP_012288042.1 Fanconi anemia group D2 protein homolog [Orussus abietinus]
MDKRKIKSKFGLIKGTNSLLSQLSSKSEDCVVRTISCNDNSTPNKRKKSQPDTKTINSDEEPLYSTVVSPPPKRKKSQLDLTQRTPKEREKSIPRTLGISGPSQKEIWHETSMPRDMDKEPNDLNVSGSSMSSPFKNSNIISSTQKEYAFTKPTKSNPAPPLINTKNKKHTKLTKGQTQNKLISFFNDAGIMSDLEDHCYLLNNDPPATKEILSELLYSGQFETEEIIDLWKEHIQVTENLQVAINNIKISKDDGNYSSLNQMSLVRILLQVPPLQTAMINCLLQHLLNSILLADSADDVPWANLLLQQFRFLEMISDSENLTNRLEELLESCPEWFQRELIFLLPDIVTDAQHHTIAEILCKLMSTNNSLTNVVLECLINLTLGKEFMDELREKVLDMLKSNLHMSAFPAVVSFVLTDCSTVNTCMKTLNSLRALEMQQLIKTNMNECFTNQVLVVNALKTSIAVSKEVAKTAMMVVKNVKKDPKPLDIIIILLIFSGGTAKRKSAESILKQHVRSGLYRTNLLNILYNEYKEVARNLQPAAIILASTLLKADDPLYVEFAIEWFRYQFVSQADTPYKQREILEKILFVIGNNNRTSKNALAVLCKMALNDDERIYLQAHCNHLKILLEMIDNLDLEEIATLNDLLHGLCTNSFSASNALQDDLVMLMQKQLSNAKPLIKSKGVLGAVMAIKHLAGKPENQETAVDRFRNVLIGVKNCPRSQALFYDQIAQVITNTTNFDINFIQAFKEEFEQELINKFMISQEDYKGNLVPRFGLNEAEKEPDINLLSFGDGKTGSVLPALFRAVRICNLCLSEDGNLNDINALLGCAILMPPDLEIPEASVLDQMMYCINWFREIISGFVTQTDALLKKQVLQRLDDLMRMQGELNTMLRLCDVNYQPPPTYFHRFPIPPFVKIEKKISKQGKKGNLERTNILPEWESWEIGSELTMKNPIYFRRLDAKVVHLLDMKMDLHLSQVSLENRQNISIAQVCFIVKELSGMLEADSTETFMRDLVHLLPKICSKLQHIVSELRVTQDAQNREAVRLIARLLTTIFKWKGFESTMYNAMLREALRTIASQMDESKAQLRSSKELVAESFKYCESLVDIATQISVALALVHLCQSLMKHSETFTQQHKDKLANMAFGFLNLEWPEEKHTTSSYKIAVNGLLNCWIDYEPNLLATVTKLLEWLPEEIEKLEKPQDSLKTLPTVNRNNFHLLFKKIFDGLIKGVKAALLTAKTDPQRIKIWQTASENLRKIIDICKTLKTRSNLLLYLKYIPILLKLFISSGIPILEYNLKYQTEEIKGILKSIQGGTKYLNTVCCHSREQKDTALTKHIPAAKSLAEQLLFRVKGMLVLNNSSGAFWMGNLVNKNLDGCEILSQSESSEEPTRATDLSTEDTSENMSSEILGSESESDIHEGLDSD